ncbi:recombinase family protein [Ovoidimarina sediminis]|uniref:recombinase family protein n=1 Tax=Ovoidimarina sediminis TaxID=3079856 RepID=UPI002906B6E1|nr:recombinase family protein [Rhodophyticola sp. MJ-SS7]MDU8946342.1 recombinase family protein [Rhodophyticola sp. MJ-SS7]
MSDKFVTCYVLAWYGARGEASRNPAVRSQISTYRQRFHDELGKGPDEFKIGFVSDYARTIRSLASLPKLQAWLDASRKIDGQPKILFEDLRRLFVRCPRESRDTLLQELREHGENIIDLRYPEKLSNFNHSQQMQLLLCGSPKVASQRQKRSSRMGKKQTEAAIRQSAEARSKRAIAQARQLSSLRADMLEKGMSITLREIAEEANNRGLKTARGGTWSPATIKRMLDRAATLDDET